MIADRVQETTATTGTGSITPSGAVSGYRTIASAFGSRVVIDYAIKDGTAWETGLGFWNGTTLARDVVRSSSASGAKISLSGTAVVFVDLLASRAARKGQQAGLAMGLGRR